MEGWKDGRMEGWKDGRMEGWKAKPVTWLRRHAQEVASGGVYLS
jgi:hypothetical protein